MTKDPQLGRLTRILPPFLLPPVLWLRQTALGKAYTRRRWVGVKDEIYWLSRKQWDRLSRARLFLVSEKRYQSMLAEMQASRKDSVISITATVACRRKNNKDSNITALLDSIVENSTDSNRVELLMKIDPDDDILYFYNIKKKYKDLLSIRIFVTDRMNGYPDGHYFHSYLVDQSDPQSKVWIVLTDDALIVHSGWDDLILAVDQMGNGFFIGGDKPLETIISPVGTAAVDEVGSPAHYMANDYPFASISVLKVIKRAVNNSNWTHFGDEFCFDAFFSAIVSKTYYSNGVNIYVSTPKFVQRGGIQVFLDLPKRSKARTESLIRFMSTESEARRQIVADALVAARKFV